MPAQERVQHTLIHWGKTKKKRYRFASVKIAGSAAHQLLNCRLSNRRRQPFESKWVQPKGKQEKALFEKCTSS
jgi:hypothetical protein